ncbi:MAG: hypothetical protein O7G87_13425 [bacterium]|nr:hypothetical protein [bacterium]
MMRLKIGLLVLWIGVCAPQGFAAGTVSRFVLGGRGQFWRLRSVALALCGFARLGAFPIDAQVVDVAGRFCRPSFRPIGAMR